MIFISNLNDSTNIFFNSINHVNIKKRECVLHNRVHNDNLMISRPFAQIWNLINHDDNKPA